MALSKEASRENSLSLRGACGVLLAFLGISIILLVTSRALFSNSVAHADTTTTSYADIDSTDSGAGDDGGGGT